MAWISYGLIVLQFGLIIADINDFSLKTYLAYFSQLLFLFPLFYSMKEKRKALRVSLPIAISIWLFFMNGFAFFAHCVGGCPGNWIVTFFPIISLALSILIFVHAFWKNGVLYVMIVSNCLILLSLFTPFMTNHPEWFPFG
jgi:hypothetical protein